MTVHELKELLKDLDEDCQIFVDVRRITYISSGADEDTDEVYYYINTDGRLYIP